VSPIDDGAVGKVISFTLPGGVEMKFCYCPAGKFEMGSPKTEEGRTDAEDAVPVQITQGYWLAQTECTQGQWEALMGSNPSNFKGNKNLPVEQVSWHDAQSLITKLKEAVRLPTGWTFELPTEAQWEYACRAGSQGPWGNITKDQMGTLEELGWYGENSGGRTHDAVTKAANAWGLYGMHGNVLEWCQDAWDGTSKLIGGPDPKSPSGSIRVLRGGAWGDLGRYCRSAYRVRGDPDLLDCLLGFRVAAVPTELK
jgi:formylglycine-generating enzyme required for sulfatase activity